MVDVLLTTASDYSFRSMFLAKQLNELFQNLAEQKRNIDLTALVYLLWVSRPFIPHETFIQQFQRVLELSEAEDIEPQEKLRATLLLMVLKAGDKGIVKAVNKRLKKLREQFPKEFKGLLPPDPTKKPKFNPPISRKK
jgi:hypothetical protein